ncbi:MAG: M23 family metallopeptidase [Acutalibacteraceae bacterium]
MKRFIAVFLMATCGALIIIAAMTGATVSKKNDFIKYAEFNVTYPALEKALNADINSQSEEIKINWIDVLAYLGAKYGGDFSQYKASDMDSIIEKLKSGQKIDSLTQNMKYYSYYRQVYGAVLDGFVGKYKETVTDENGNKTTNEKYGLKVYSPIAKTFPYSHYDDFGASRTYGYARNHLGHDLLAATGTPVISVESGTVEVMGWNQYGGWRIGIRSFDKKRYYYYAHLRQNRPYHCDLYEGKTVNAGDVIGYVGRTGYSTKENVNNIETSHLHFGMELIFDESQKECDNEIWIDLYAITLLLEKHKSEVVRIPETKEFYSTLNR